MAPPDHDHVPDPDLPTAGDLDALGDRLDALNRHMAILVDKRIAEKTVPREELRQRLRSSGKKTVAALVALALVLVVVAGFVWNNRRNSDRLHAACEGRNAQSRESKKLLERFSVAEVAENKMMADEYRALARQATDPERARFLRLLAELELKRDQAVAGLFQELADNVRIQDC